ncbi:hypothetical protein AMATHDRAFT_63430 [Amanita thiersii Skay4041]|uniref:Uncharacterized protein n=1 Tax=Amanita thiersii Skay4041 TaxID=703135 RepID=A0A2A9NLV1_9AGAR|nr:hypothetical protein AMATHDRAFT_63430 [Amanita thiersii Skay4041]
MMDDDEVSVMKLLCFGVKTPRVALIGGRRGGKEVLAGMRRLTFCSSLHSTRLGVSTAHAKRVRLVR